MISKSPKRGTFHIDRIIQRVESGEQSVEEAEEMIDFYKSWEERRREQEATDEWKKDNMEYDLRTTEWILHKVRSDDVYAQHLYAAMCNNEFTKNDVIPILTEKRWSASWRSAGGIIANMQEKGDYIDWYCSGIRNGEDMEDSQFRELTKEQQESYLQTKAYVSESVVTAEIRTDLLKLGWIVIEDSDNDNLV
jgi:hypothetical protein